MIRLAANDNAGPKRKRGSYETASLALRAGAARLSKVSISTAGGIVEAVSLAIAVAIRPFSEFSELRREADNLRQALEDRKIIERAKGVLMQTLSWNEAAARKTKLVDLARRVLAGDLVPGNNPPSPEHHQR